MSLGRVLLRHVQDNSKKRKTRLKKGKVIKTVSHFHTLNTHTHARAHTSCSDGKEGMVQKYGRVVLHVHNSACTSLEELWVEPKKQTDRQRKQPESTKPMNIPFARRQRKATMAGRPLGGFDGEEREVRGTTPQPLHYHDAACAMVTQTPIIRLLHEHESFISRGAASSGTDTRLRLTHF